MPSAPRPIIRPRPTTHALSRIPGLSEATADYIRELVESGVSGPIVAVDDGPDKGVRIVIE
jgi:hypothetical protein